MFINNTQTEIIRELSLNLKLNQFLWAYQKVPLDIITMHKGDNLYVMINHNSKIKMIVISGDFVIINSYVIDTKYLLDKNELTMEENQNVQKINIKLFIYFSYI